MYIFLIQLQLNYVVLAGLEGLEPSTSPSVAKLRKEAQLQQKLRCNVSNIALKECSRRVGAAAFKPAETYRLGFHI